VTTEIREKPPRLAAFLFLDAASLAQMPVTIMAKERA